MTIFILDNAPAKCAQALDDKSLDKMIKDIVQVLCNVHWFDYYHEGTEGYVYKNKLKIPIKYKKLSDDLWTVWARECRANYLYLVELAELCSRELNYRFEGLTENKIDYEIILLWAKDNVPDIYDPHKIVCTNEFTLEHIKGKPTPFPLVIPKKCLDIDVKKYSRWNSGLRLNDQISIYRNYYLARLKQIFKYNKGILWMGLLKEHGICIECNKHKVRWTRREKPEWL